MPNIKEFDAGNLTLRPSETGVEATAMTARRISAFSNQLGGAEEMLARETERLANQTSRVGSETQQLGRETGELGDFEGNLTRDAGRRFASTVTDVGTVALQQIEHQEINKGAASWAGMVERKTKEWNDTAANANPNDPTTAHAFMAGMENELQSFRNGFLTENGQKWAESHIDAFRLHMAEKAQADMATMAGIAAETNVRQTINSLSNTVHGDPSSLTFALAGLNSSIEGSISTSPNLKGPEGAKLREKLQQGGAESIVKSAAVGYIEKTGQVPPWATDPQFSKYINGAELTMLARAAKTQQRADSLAAKQELLTNKTIADNQAHVQANKLFSDSVTADSEGNLVIAPNFSNRVLDFMRKNPDAPSTRTIGENLLNWQQREQNRDAGPSAAASHAAARQAIVDMRDGKITDTNPIYKMLGDGQINKADFNFLNKEIRDRKSDQGAPLAKDRDEFFKRYAASVDGAMDLGGHSALGSQKMYAFEMEARRQETDLLKQGKDPHQLYDPNSPNFIGNLVPKYHVSFQEAQQFEKKIQGEQKKNPNLTGPDRDSTIVSTEDKFAPPPNWQYSPSRKQYRDPSGKLYDKNGKLIEAR